MFFRIVISVNRKKIQEYMDKLKLKAHQRLELDAECLRWTPLISNQTLLEEEKRAEKEVGPRFRLPFGAPTTSRYFRVGNIWVVVWWHACAVKTISVWDVTSNSWAFLVCTHLHSVTFVSQGYLVARYVIITLTIIHILYVVLLCP